MDYIFLSLGVVGVIGLLAATILFFVAKKFHVAEDPRIAEIEDILPGANCGGCGLSGCAAFARACCTSSSLDGLNCTGIGDEEMAQIATIVGLAEGKRVRKVAVIRCNAACETRQLVNHFEGIRSCALEHAYYQGESACNYGCLGLGDCVVACPFGAMTFSESQDYPTVDESKCTGCGKCLEACPRDLPQMREVKPGLKLVYVNCSNKNKGPQAMKDCEVSCIGCGLCKKKCPTEAITLESFLATIHGDKCISCLECVAVCPRKSIIAEEEPAPLK